MDVQDPVPSPGHQGVARPGAIDDPTPATVRFLDRKVGSPGCVLAWGLATAVFVLMVVGQYGPTTHDAIQWDTPAWTLAHGLPQCTYAYHFQTEPPPVLPLMVAGAEAVAHSVDHRLFPEGPARATNCRHAFTDLSAPAPLHDAALLGFVGWLVLLGGFVAAVRAMGRGRTRWEVAGVVVLAVLPPIAATLTVSIHPEDLVALGFVLAATARSMHRRDVVTGLLLGLAVCSQQFALLAAVPIVVLADWRERGRLVLGAAAMAIVVSLPFALTGPSGVVHAYSGASATTADGPTPTLVVQLHLSGVPLLVASRVLPLVLAGLAAWWVRRRSGPSAWEPVTLVALVAVALTLRLVFEVNLFIGYFAAVSATLLVLACASGTPRRWRRWLLAWAGWNVVVAAAYGGNSWRSVVQGVASGVALQVLVVGWAMALAVVPLAVGSWRGARRREDPPPAKEPSEAPSGSDLLGFSGRS